ncbi:MAG: potassium-transporting ATPase subunit KdpB [Candidatus Berkiellales bacterium]
MKQGQVEETMQTHLRMHASRRVKEKPLFEKKMMVAAFKQSIIMLRPDIQWKNPVMFVVEIGALLTLCYILHMLYGAKESQAHVTYFIALDGWLFLTVLFANFATALAETRGKAQADSLKLARHETVAYRLKKGKGTEEVSSTALMRGDRVVVRTGQIIPSDGEIIEGVAYVDESMITGESAPVIREAGGDRSGVTGGTIVLSAEKIIIEVTANKGESFLDRMIALIETAIRQRTPNEIALSLVLSAFTLVFLIVVVPIWPMALNVEYTISEFLNIKGTLSSLGTDVPTLIALLVCLIPTTIGALLAAIGIAGMDRALQANIIATSGKAVELGGDIDVVLVDKTGTITIGNRKASKFLPLNKYSEIDLGKIAALASVADTTPEGKSILDLYEKQSNTMVTIPVGAKFLAFKAETRMSGIDLADGRRIRKGAVDAIVKFVESNGGTVPNELDALINQAAAIGATPLVVAEENIIAGIIVLKDILKPHIHEKFARLRRMGLKIVMITGDNAKTAATIATEAGVDDFIAEVTPEAKLNYIRKQQAAGNLVAMMGDGTNDAPALAQADVGLAMNAGTMAAKEAANMVDLDSDPTKLIDVIEIGKQLLITRGALTTFSIANDLAKYFAIIPALFAGTLPWLKGIDIMHLHSPTSAILSAVIFNALIIPALIPVALKGIRYRALGADELLRRNLLIWGLGGIILPFIGIKIIDLIMVSLKLVH